ncbi:MAG: site-specific integrase [Eubacteriales bacterium]
MTNLENAKTMITIRFKPLRSGEYSVFLDDYNKGKRQRTFLGLRVTKDYSKNRFIAKEDIPAMEKARKIAQEMSTAENVIALPIKNAKPSLITFIEQQSNKSEKKSYTYQSLIKHLQYYSGKKDLTFSSVNKKWIEGYQNYLHEIMTESTVNGMIWYFKRLLNDAVKMGYIQENPLSEMKFIHFKKDRTYLTDAEIEVLINTPINTNPQIFQSFLFSLHSGLTWEQVSSLTWEQIGRVKKNRKEMWTVTVNGYLNHATYTNELNPQAVAILKELAFLNVYNGSANVCQHSLNVSQDKISVSNCMGNVFKRLPNKSNCNIKLRLWGAMAGLDKSLCFSMARNTFAMKHIEAGADIRQMKRLLNVTSYGIVEVFQRMNKNKSDDQSKV